MGQLTSNRSKLQYTMIIEQVLNGRITVSDSAGVLWINAFRQIYLIMGGAIDYCAPALLIITAMFQKVAI